MKALRNSFNSPVVPSKGPSTAWITDPEKEQEPTGQPDPDPQERPADPDAGPTPPDPDMKGEPPQWPKGADRQPGGPMRPPRRSFRTLSIWLLVAMGVFVLAQQIFTARTAGTEISYTEFWEAVKHGLVDEVTIIDRNVKGQYRETPESEPKRFHTYLPSADDQELMKLLRGEDADGVTGPGGRLPIKIRSKPDPTPWFSMIFTWLPFLLLIGLWFFLIRQMQGGGSAALKFGKSKAKMLHENTIQVTFDDVAGIAEAKQELEEIIEFLKEPKKFRRLGGRIPKGVLLVGPPGTGKTLLARAVAGEAGVPFFSISGSDFVEMFVGVGAARVRDLFDQGKRSAPCIVFVDELDAVGRHRGAGLGGGHDEREQTLNQLLVEMDGFDANQGVILLAATNRPDVLDPALLRPGRFDRQVVLDLPDVRGREGIISVHVRGKPLDSDVDLHILARGTPGLAGADLENLVNEAALMAARRDQDVITMLDFEEAKDKVMMGTERRSMIIPEKEKKITAYHEAGHALVAWFLPDTDPIHKVTVIPRGRSLGLTQWLPEDDRHVNTQEHLEQTMAAILGGRAAEELVFGRITTGAANDIQRATEVARLMVCEWGMSERLGPIQFGKRDQLIFLGKEIGQQKDFSEHTAQVIDEEVNRIVRGAHEKATQLLRDNLDKLHTLATTLLECEILDREEIGKILDDASSSRAGRYRETRAPGTEAGEAVGKGPVEDRAEEDRAEETGVPGPQTQTDKPSEDT